MLLLIKNIYHCFCCSKTTVAGLTFCLFTRVIILPSVWITMKPRYSNEGIASLALLVPSALTSSGINYKKDKWYTVSLLRQST